MVRDELLWELQSSLLKADNECPISSRILDAR